MSLQKKLESFVKILAISYGLTLLILLIVFGSFLLMFLNYSYCEYDYYFEICIDKNKEIKKYASSGFGLASHPFIIDNLEFTGSYEIGLRITGISRYIILRNIQFQAKDAGLSLGYLDSGLITVENCSFLNCDMEVNRCNSVTIINNTFHENEIGIYLSQSLNNVIISNHFDSGGLFFENIGAIPSHIIQDNYIQGKEILYLEDKENISISGNCSQIFLINCNNILVEGLNLYSVSQFFLIKNSENSTIRDSIVRFYGILGRIIDSSNITISNISSTQLQISSNLMSDIYECIFLESLHVSNTSYFTLRNSTISNSRNSAVAIYRSKFSLIEFNDIFNSFDFGLRVVYSNYCKIFYNQFKDNMYEAVSLYQTNNCFVHHNNFLNNTWLFVGPQGYDSSLTNYWYLPSENAGNFWSNLGNSTTYLINASNDICDLYPFSEPIDIIG